MNRPSIAMRKTLLAALLAAPIAAAWADTASIYQQRAEDGSVVLTDRPSPTAVTLRTWQLQTPSPAAARQREAQMRADAEAVSARVQQTLDRQQAEAEAEGRARQRAAEREEERRAAEQRYGDDTVLDPYGAAAPLVFPYAERQNPRAPLEARPGDEPQRLGTVNGRSRPAPGAMPPSSIPRDAATSPGTDPARSSSRSPGMSPTTATPVSPGGAGTVN